MAHPESRQRLLDFFIAELPIDSMKVPDGAVYESFLDIFEMRAHQSLRSEVEGIWSGRHHQMAGGNEYKIFLDLEVNPNIISIREQYPFPRAGVLEDVLAGKEISRNRVMTIDFVVTLPARNFGGPLRYMGLSSKPDSLASRPSAQRRAQREARELGEVGWSWSAVKAPPKERVDSLNKLREWAKFAPIDLGAMDASRLAAALYKTESKKCLSSLLRMLGRRVGISEGDQYFVFATAVYLGYVTLSRSAPVHEELPLVLAAPVRGLSGAFNYG